MAAKLGMNAKLYYLPTGSRATWGAATNGIHIGSAPSGLSEISNCKDVTVNLETGEADVTTRGNNGFRATEPTLKDASIEFEMIYDSADTAMTDILEAWLGNTSLPVAALDGDKATAGVMGLWADFKVTNFTKSEALEDAQTVSVTLKPAYSTVAPEWVKVGS